MIGIRHVYNIPLNCLFTFAWCRMLLTPVNKNDPMSVWGQLMKPNTVNIMFTIDGSKPT